MDKSPLKIAVFVREEFKAEREVSSNVGQGVQAISPFKSTDGLITLNYLTICK